VALGVLCLAVFLVVVDNTIVNVALPTLSRTLHASNTSLQWIVDAYSLSFAGLLLAGGGLGDRWGRRGVLQVGLLLFGLFSLLASTSHSTGALIVWRTLMGAAAALVYPATLAILTSLYSEPRARQRALGIWGATSGIAVALGPVSGGLLLEHLWVGSIFLVGVPIAILASLLAFIAIPTSPRINAGPFDLPGVGLSAIGLASLVLYLIDAPAWGWGSLRALSLLIGSFLILVTFLLRERTTKFPLLQLRVFADRQFRMGAGATAIAYFALFGFIFVITQYFQLVKGYSTLSAGLHTLPFAGVTAIATPFGAHVAMRRGTRSVIAIGLSLMAAGLLIGGANTGAHVAYVGPILLSMVVLALGFALLTAPSTEAVMGALPPDQLGRGAAVNNTTRELGGTFGVAIIGSVFASTYGAHLSTLTAPWGGRCLPTGDRRYLSRVGPRTDAISLPCELILRIVALVNEFAHEHLHLGDLRTQRRQLICWFSALLNKE
jgi:EmrB/QacA subfamily drug resistance transporter